ncbi:MAG: hypothetical protein HYV09_15220 [Deltaproteobacteria bacterium]|nr:hypothetical protein [Deltaproteobacteria bacterium]
MIDSCSIVACPVTGVPVIEVTAPTWRAHWHPVARAIAVTVDDGRTWAPSILGVAVACLAEAARDAAATARALVNRRARLEIERLRREDRYTRMDVRERLDRYVSRLEPAQAGRCGKGVQCNSYNRIAFAVVARLLRTFNVDDATAIAALTPWAASCTPALPRHRLVRLVADARKRGRAAA